MLTVDDIPFKFNFKDISKFFMVACIPLRYTENKQQKDENVIFDQLTTMYLNIIAKFNYYYDKKQLGDNKTIAIPPLEIYEISKETSVDALTRAIRTLPVTMKNLNIIIPMLETDNPRVNIGFFGEKPSLESDLLQQKTTFTPERGQPLYAATTVVPSTGRPQETRKKEGFSYEFWGSTPTQGRLGQPYRSSGESSDVFRQDIPQSRPAVSPKPYTMSPVGSSTGRPQETRKKEGFSYEFWGSTPTQGRLGQPYRSSGESSDVFRQDIPQSRPAVSSEPFSMSLVGPSMETSETRKKEGFSYEFLGSTSTQEIQSQPYRSSGESSDVFRQDIPQSRPAVSPKPYTMSPVGSSTGRPQETRKKEGFSYEFWGSTPTQEIQSQPYRSSGESSDVFRQDIPQSRPAVSPKPYTMSPVGSSTGRPQETRKKEGFSYEFWGSTPTQEIQSQPYRSSGESSDVFRQDIPQSRPAVSPKPYTMSPVGPSTGRPQETRKKEGFSYEFWGSTPTQEIQSQPYRSSGESSDVFRQDIPQSGPAVSPKPYTMSPVGPSTGRPQETRKKEGFSYEFWGSTPTQEIQSQPYRSSGESSDVFRQDIPQSGPAVSPKPYTMSPVGPSTRKTAGNT